MVPPLMFGSSRGGTNALRPGFTGDGHVADTLTGVRRLTPVECCRLQGLPDNWFQGVHPCPDSRMYAGLGDAVTANVAEWIGRRLAQ